MKTIFRMLCGAALLVASPVAAQQFSSELWHEGFLVSTDEDTIRGMLKYDMETNVVQVIEATKVVKTYSSHKIFYFEIFDKILKSYRQFYSVPYNVNFNYSVPLLFEVLYEGPMSLLSRETIVQETVTSGSAYWGGSYVRNRLAYTFYFLNKDGNIRFYTGKKRDLVAILSRKGSQVKSFIKKNRLRTDEPGDLIRITAFYNSL